MVHWNRKVLHHWESVLVRVSCPVGIVQSPLGLSVVMLALPDEIQMLEPCVCVYATWARLWFGLTGSILQHADWPALWKRRHHSFSTTALRPKLDNTGNGQLWITGVRGSECNLKITYLCECAWRGWNTVGPCNLHRLPEKKWQKSQLAKFMGWYCV